MVDQTGDRVPMDFNRSTFKPFLLDQTRMHIEGR